jgi:hypothetical protein
MFCLALAVQWLQPASPAFCLQFYSAMPVKITVTCIVDIQHHLQYDIRLEVVDPGYITIAEAVESCEIRSEQLRSLASTGQQARFYYAHRGQLVHLDSDETLRALCATRGQKKLFLKCA